MLRYSSFFRNSSSNKLRVAVDINQFRPRLAGFRRILEYSFDDGIRVHTFCLAFEVEKNSVAKSAKRYGPDVLARNMHAIVEQGTDLSSDYQSLGTARA